MTQTPEITRYEIRYHGAPYATGDTGHTTYATDHATTAARRWIDVGSAIRRESSLVAVDGSGREYAAEVRAGGDWYELGIWVPLADEWHAITGAVKTSRIVRAGRESRREG